MSLIQWKPTYSLGIPSVDGEHRDMIDMINRVYADLEGSPEPASVEAVLGDIHAGISAHFALEERLMKSAGYSGYEEHKQSHELLLDQIRDLMDGFAADPAHGKQELQRRLGDWFSLHFATLDARLHQQLGNHAQAL